MVTSNIDFDNTGRLTSIIIPDSVTSIGEGAFKYNRLTSVTIGNSVKTIGKEAFSDNKLTSVTIPASVTSIGEKAFAWNQLSSVMIPNSVTTIGNGAFSTNQLTGVTIPSSVTTIGNWAFASNSRLTTITVDPANRSFSGKDGILYSKDGKTLVCYPAGKGTSAVIPDGVTSIGNYAFSGNQLTSVTIPASVTTIGDGAFGECQLSSVTIGANAVISTNGYDYGNTIPVFTEFYNNNGKKAGVYTLNGNTWSYRAR